MSLTAKIYRRLDDAAARLERNAELGHPSPRSRRYWLASCLERAAAAFDALTSRQ